MEGVRLSVAVAVLEGAVVGTADGVRLGTGVTLGAYEMKLGASEGVRVGNALGLWVKGTAEEAMVGTTEGLRVGSLVGFILGVAVGSLVGARDGKVVNVLEGLWMGTKVGSTVGKGRSGAAVGQDEQRDSDKTVHRKQRTGGAAGAHGDGCLSHDISNNVRSSAQDDCKTHVPPDIYCETKKYHWL
jgi:hypothetical protein